MPTFELFGIALLGALCWLWFDSLKARDAGIEAASAACASENCQLLDDTVAITRVRLVRSDNGRLALRRVYDFEYSDTGDNRRRGSVVMLGHRVVVVNIGLRLVVSNRTLH